MSETERAIEYFKQYETYLGNKISEYLSKSFNSVGEYTEELTKEKSVYSLAITALRAQSEAENIDEYSVSGMIGILRDIKESGLRAKSNSMRTFGQKDAIDCAISLLHSKSEAERKIEKAREFISARELEIVEMVSNGDSAKIFDFELSGYEAILEILEGAE